MLTFTKEYFRLLDGLRASLQKHTQSENSIIAFLQQQNYSTRLLSYEPKNLFELYSLLGSLCDWRETMNLSVFVYFDCGPVSFSDLSVDLSSMVHDYYRCYDREPFFRKLASGGDEYARKALILQVKPDTDKLLTSTRHVDVATRCLVVTLLCKFLCSSASPKEKEAAALLLEAQMTNIDRYYVMSCLSAGYPSVPPPEVLVMYQQIEASERHHEVLKFVPLLQRRKARKLIKTLTKAANPSHSALGKVSVLSMSFLYIVCVLIITHVAFLRLVM
ncbi:ORF104 [Ranid herpesvirus 2]|uniref:ORF104 n=1 Tax=Ranid herpesvirus 2 TaxID=389214 RepID=Q14W02_9VIRU|nr:ORF104 [Ranid herpesvirus 2]ABG25660.1 ORF104 [Ranid herpesvirus 2]